MRSVIMNQTQVARPADAVADQKMDVRFVAGDSYEVTVRGHHVLVDQPVEAGGADEAPTPTELFVASLATCIAFYAGRYLNRHGVDREGLGVSVAFQMAADRPPRVAAIRLTVRVPAGLPPERWPALHAVVSHCTVHNTLADPPAVVIDLT
jgi:putative redox protein